MVCILCAKRGRTTELDAGQVCAVCATRIGDDLDAIPRLASMASVEPRSGRGSGRTVPASRPPIDLDGVDPALTLVVVGSGPTTVLEVCESWERLLREHRGMAPYGPVSATRATAAARDGDGRYVGTLGLLRACTAFLRLHVEWMTSEPTWPIEDIADELRACHRALRRFDADAEPAATVVLCPSERHDSGPCGGRIILAEHPRCPACGRDWDRDMLVRAAAAAPQAADVWVDVLAASAATGVPARTIQRWARLSHIRRRQGRYAIADIQQYASGA